MTSVSVVITCHNEAGAIGPTLQTVAAQVLPTGWSLEIVMVDDRSTDGTVAEALAQNLPNLRLFHAAPVPDSPLTTRQQALDMGFRAAMGEVVLTLDADSRLQPGWVAAMAGPILQGRREAMAGPVAFQPVSTAVGGWMTADACYYFEVARGLAAMGLRGGVFFGNFAFKLNLYTDVGGFSTIGPALTEDLAFYRALAAHGARIGQNGANARVEVRAARGFGAVVERLLRVTRGPVSGLSFVLTLWPLTLVAAAIWGLVTGGWWVLALRWAVGAGLVAHAIRRNGPPGVLRWAVLYEPMAIGLALAGIVRKMRGKPLTWGGRSYD
jgi:glycosyltransferase involved in cell wall biosynthesis